jgi:simple sugar transport system ATP-binding protein
MDEVLEISDRITVLRRGRIVGSFLREDADAQTLAARVLGEGEISPRVPRSPRTKEKAAVLSVRGISGPRGRSAASSIWTAERNGTLLHGINFEIREGEILSIAGVDGNGQEELTEILAGVRAPSSGNITLGEEDITSLGARERHERGLAVLPGDRAHQGLFLDLAVWENLAVRRYGAGPTRGAPFWVDVQTHRREAERLSREFDVRGPGIDAKARHLSGGNQQKLLLAREVARPPRVLVAHHATRGLDIGAAASVIERVLDLRDGGAAILWISTELDEALDLGDRVGVLVRGVLRDATGLSREEVGAAMLTGMERSRP